MAKTYEEINDKIRKGKAVVVTAEEMIDIVREEGEKKAAEKVDVVTTGTFGTMCSSGAFLNLGHATPRIKIQKAWLNDVEAYAGLAAVDIYIGVTQVVEDDPLNSRHPGEFRYGGGHVIEELIAGKDVKLVAHAYGTDSVDPRMERVPRDLRRKTIRDDYLKKHREWFLKHHENALKKFDDSVAALYSNKGRSTQPSLFEEMEEDETHPHFVSNEE